VAALAGIPTAVTSQARRYLAELERERDALRTRNSRQIELDLSVPPPAAPATAALDALRAADPDRLTPREALELLYRLKQLDGGV